MPMRPINRLLALARHSRLAPPIARALIVACDDAEQSLRSTGKVLPALYFVPLQPGKLRTYRFATDCGPEPVRARIASDMRPGETVVAVLCAVPIGSMDAEQRRCVAIHVESLNTAPVVFVAPAPDRELGMFKLTRAPGRLLDAERRLD